MAASRKIGDSGERNGVGDMVSGGYKVTVCGEVNPTHLCPICHLLMRTPIQTLRGELACKDCYEEVKGDSDVCPLDKEPISKEEIFLDKCQGKEILQLRCRCPNKDLGCSWEGTVSEFAVHEEDCSYKPTYCSLCKNHVSKEGLEQHLRDCLMSHGNGECVFPCCTFKASSPEQLEAHVTHNLLHHAILMSNSVLETQEALKRKTEREKEMEQKNGKMEIQIQTMSKEIIKWKREQEIKVSQLEMKVEDLESKWNTEVMNNSERPSISRVSEAVVSLQQKVSTLNLQQQLLDNRSSEGRLVWKIDNVLRRMEDAKRGQVVALHSAPVYTEIYGYKFCGRIFLNGDGLGRGTHVSLFFVVMKSEYDSLLIWPFKKRIVMRLINQEDRKSDVVECFDTDVNSSSFCRPVRDMNVSSGCPRFVAQRDLIGGGFVKDDALFIEITVDDVPAVIGYH